ncbi:MAG: cytochrome-c oxidase [Calditrichaeota bacterium]|nr:MAG: cytochrome-c oxidase [Calditrichota bacterium]
MKHEEKTHSVGYTVYIFVWLALVVLTSVTVVVAGVQLHQLAVAVAILIASVKSYLVMSYFMHLKYEPPLFKLMVAMLLVTFAIFIGLTFTDIIFRY